MISFNETRLVVIAIYGVCACVRAYVRTYRYIPVGLLERVQKINERPPYYLGRDYLETLMASQHVDDWIRIR